MSITLEILEAAQIIGTTKGEPLVLMNRSLTILTEGFLISCQWRYILFFLRKKIEKDEQSDNRMSKTVKVLFVWIFLVLIMNSLNFIGYNVVEAIIELQVIETDNTNNTLTDIWKYFSMFWYDILNLTNGLYFLYLFK